jgi:hypothetical protein
MSTRIKGVSNLADVDSNSNLKTNLPTVISQAGYVIPVSEVDPGTITGSSLRRAINVSQGRRMAVGLDTPIFDFTFNATAQDTSTWKCVFTTMTITQGSGSALFNAGSATVSGNIAGLQSWRMFNLLEGGPLKIELSLLATAVPLTNQVGEWGLFQTAATIADGVYFRYSSAGLYGVINYGGVETVSSLLLASITAGTTYNFTIIIGEGSTEFWYDLGAGAVLMGTITTPAAQSEPFAFGALPVCVQQRNSGTVSGSPQMQLKWSDVSVMQKSLNLTMPFSEQVALCRGNHQGMSGGTMGMLALLTNSLAAGAGAAMTNTTAALGTGLGGQFSAQPTLAAGTDGIVCSYQNPAGSVNQTPRTLVITGIHVSSMVNTALTGGPCQFMYSLAWGHTAVSAATAESASFATNTTKAPRRMGVGLETIAATAAVGVTGTPGGIHVLLNSPIIVNPGEFVALLAKNFGTVTSAGVVTFLVTFDHHWI